MTPRQYRSAKRNAVAALLGGCSSADLSEREQDVDRDREDQLAIAQVLLAVAVTAMPTMCVMIAHVRN